jgi:hypothetical protein
MAIADRIQKNASEMYSKASKDMEATSKGIQESVKKGEYNLNVAVNAAKNAASRDSLVKDLLMAYLTGGGMGGVKSMIQDKLKEAVFEKVAEATGINPQLVKLAFGKFNQMQAQNRMESNFKPLKQLGFNPTNIVANINAHVSLTMGFQSSLLGKLGLKHPLADIKYIKDANKVKELKAENNQIVRQSVESAIIATGVDPNVVSFLGGRYDQAKAQKKMQRSVGGSKALANATSNVLNSSIFKAIAALPLPITLIGSSLLQQMPIVQNNNNINTLRQREKQLVQDSLGKAVAVAVGRPDAAGNFSQVVGGILKRREAKRSNTRLDSVIDRGIGSGVNMVGGVVKGILKNAVVAFGGNGQRFDAMFETGLVSPAKYSGVAKIDLDDKLREEAFVRFVQSNGVEEDVSRALVSKVYGRYKEKKAMKKEKSEAISSTAQLVVSSALTFGLAAGISASVNGVVQASTISKGFNIAMSVANGTKNGKNGVKAAVLNGLISAVGGQGLSKVMDKIGLGFFDKLPEAFKSMNLGVTYDKENGWGGSIDIGSNFLGQVMPPSMQHVLKGGMSVNLSERGDNTITAFNRGAVSLTYNANKGSINTDIKVEKLFGSKVEDKFNETIPGIKTALGLKIDSRKGIEAKLGFTLKEQLGYKDEFQRDYMQDQLGMELSADERGAFITGQMKGEDVFRVDRYGFEYEKDFGSKITSKIDSEMDIEEDRRKIEKEIKDFEEDIKPYESEVLKYPEIERNLLNKEKKLIESKTAKEKLKKYTKDALNEIESFKKENQQNKRMKVELGIDKIGNEKENERIEIEKNKLVKEKKDIEIEKTKLAKEKKDIETEKNAIKKFKEDKVEVVGIDSSGEFYNKKKGVKLTPAEIEQFYKDKEESKKRDEESKKRDEESKKRDEESKKRDAEINKEFAEMKKRDAESKKRDAESKKRDEEFNKKQAELDKKEKALTMKYVDLDSRVKKLTEQDEKLTKEINGLEKGIKKNKDNYKDLVENLEAIKENQERLKKKQDLLKYKEDTKAEYNKEDAEAGEDKGESFIQNTSNAFDKFLNFFRKPSKQEQNRKEDDKKEKEEHEKKKREYEESQKGK